MNDRLQVDGAIPRAIARAGTAPRVPGASRRNGAGDRAVQHGAEADPPANGIFRRAARGGLWPCLVFLALSGCANFRPRHQEGPATALTVGNVTVTFQGVTAFPEGDLRDALAEPLDTLQRSGVNRATGDDAAFFLELFYRKNGYADASASFTVLGGNALRLEIKEGPRVVLGDVNFTGNRAAPDATLREYVVGPTRERFPKGKTDLPYFQGDVDKGLDLIGRYYLSEGYLDAKVSPPAVEFTQGHTRADLAIAVAEGREYRFGAVTLTGPLAYPEPEVRGVIADQIAQPYTRPRVDSMARKLEQFYKTRGHYQAAVTAVSDPNQADAGGRIPATFVVNPGPVFRFDGTTVRGTDRLKPQFLKNRFAKLTGETYSAARLDEVYQQMLRTGLFSLLQVNPVPQDDGTLRLDLDVKEAKARDFGVSLGYGTYEGPILGLELRDRDLNGTGRPLSLTLDYSTRTLLGDLTYRDPYLFETDNELRLSLTAQSRNLDTYTKQEEGFIAELTRPIGKKLRLTAFVQAKHDDLSNFQADPANIGTVSYNVTSLGGSAALDLRDSPVTPTRGFYATVSADTASRAFGGTLDFVRGTFRASYLQPIGKKFSLAAGFRAGVVAPYGNTQTIDGNSRRYQFRDDDPKTPPISIPKNVFPIDERFFNGGATSVRSFAERQLGPQDIRYNNPIGGQAYTVFNVEGQFPIVNGLPDLRGAVFVDAGNLLPRARDFGVDNLRYAIGLGIRYNLPIGPLRVDYGVNPNPRHGEAIGAFHLTFGLAF